jgi:bifunctional DNase/RNase
MRSGTTIYAEESVLAEAGVAIPDEQESEVEEFKKFLDEVSPEDFERDS